ncbi:MAG: radical SAM family heme chaperone HemW [Sedimentisphaerales bacterium]|nr:radical SAM family heme chaperone HemW [Sedimentisphaerales bacterium]
MIPISEPISLYVHIPFCKKKCRYCSFYSEPAGKHDTKRFVKALIAELEMYDFQRAVRTVYIGGGSPTSLGGSLLLSLIKSINLHCRTASEFTVEVNPGQVDLQLLKKLRKLKVNRLSIGAQSFNQPELDFLGRGHSPEDIEKAVVYAKKAGFENIGLDLIFAIPGAREDYWVRSLRSAFYLGPQHISVYSLTYEPGSVLYDDRQAGRLKPVDEETDRGQYEFAIEELARAGFIQYEISNFARGGFTCRHNLAYWKNKPYIGIGPAAASSYRNERKENIDDIERYIEAIENGRLPSAGVQSLSPLEVACETAVLDLRCMEGIDLEQFISQTGFDARQLFSKSIDRLYCQSLIEIKNGCLSLTRKAFPIADSVLSDFSSPD